MQFSHVQWLPHTRTRLVDVFDRDRPLGVAALVLLLAACLPLFLTPFLPFCDLPLNTAAAELLWDAALGRMPAAGYLQINHAPVPYWVPYALACLLGRIFGPLIGAKVLTALVIALLPLATLRLLVSLERDPRLMLWAFPLVWQQNLYAGWLAFMLGIELTFFVIAWLLEARDVRDGLRVAPYGALVALTHVQATFLMGIAGIALILTTGRTWRRVVVHAVGGAGAILVTAIWLGLDLASRGSASGGPPFTFAWHSPSTRLSQIFAHTLDNFSQPDAERVAAIVFVIAVLGPLVLTQLPARAVRDRASPLLLVGVAGLLYATLWWEVNGPIAHWYTYPRYAVVTLALLLLVPAPRLRGFGSLALLPGVLGALWLDFKVAEQFAAFGDETRPFLQILERVRPRASALAIVNDDDDRDANLKAPPYHQFYAYITALNHGYSPYLWTSTASPIFYRAGPQLPAPGWGGAFSIDTHGAKYDYILVQGFARGDPVANAVSATGLSARLLVEAARWRLYQVH